MSKRKKYIVKREINEIVTLFKSVLPNELKTRIISSACDFRYPYAAVVFVEAEEESLDWTWDVTANFREVYVRREVTSILTGKPFEVYDVFSVSVYADKASKKTFNERCDFSFFDDFINYISEKLPTLKALVVAYEMVSGLDTTVNITPEATKPLNPFLSEPVAEQS